jgi:hypothetical protein
LTEPFYKVFRELNEILSCSLGDSSGELLQVFLVASVDIIAGEKIEFDQSVIIQFMNDNAKFSQAAKVMNRDDFFLPV